MTEWNRVWHEGMAIPWSSEALADPTWGPDAVRAALPEWRRGVGADIELDCDEFPCVILVPIGSSMSTFDVEKSVAQALDATGHWPGGTPFGVEYPGILGIGLADPTAQANGSELVQVRVEHRIEDARDRLAAVDRAAE